MNINSSLKKTPIAVVGMSSMFADAKNLEEFWTNIVQSKDSIVEIPESRWSISDYYDADMNAEDKTYCKVGGFLPDIDFNPMEFGLPPNILEVTDVSQLLALVAARDAFEDAGYGQKSAKFTAEVKERTGVLLGVGGGQKLITPLTARLQFPIWERALRSSGVAEEDIPVIVDKMKKAYIGWNENSFPGMLGNVISGRITNRFDLGGINSVVDAACAASLSAIKMAVSELIEGRVDMMLTGGVDTDNSPFMYMSFSKTPAFSKSGQIRPFDDAADGMLIGEGIGMLVLKRLEDAERDGDRIYALIKGVGTSSDGRFKSVYAPRPSGQALAMRRTYEDAGFEPSTVGLIEGHGTGTGAGDPTEFESMQMVFGENNPKKNEIGIGSVKSQVGHTKAAAGSAGMIKAALALYHKVLPGSINVTKPNTKFNIEDSAFYVNSETRPWFKKEHPRRVGVSAFGFGGINVHFALEEYNSEPLQQDRIHVPYHSILLRSNTPEELLAQCQDTLSGLNDENADKVYLELKKASEAFKVSKNEARLGFVAESIEDCVHNLNLAVKLLQTDKKNSWDHPKGIYFRPHGIDERDKVVALFSGQGSQYVGMGTAIVNAYPEVQKAYSKLDSIFQKDHQTALSDVVFPKPVFTNEEKEAQQAQLTQTQFAQPAIGSLSMGLFKTMTNAGFKADFMAGHSFGELTALWAGEAISDDHYVFLAKARGQAMAQHFGQTDSGSMLAVKGTEEQVTPFLSQMDSVTIANLNSSSQLVLGGSTPAIAKAKDLLSNNGIKSVVLPVSAAFHTSYVGHAQKPFAEAIQSCEFKSATTPVYSNTTAQPYPADAEEMKNILGGHILNAVQFKSQIENIYNAGGRVFVEIGPKPVLTNLVKDILKDKDHFAVATNPNTQKNSDLQLRQAVVQLQVLGLPISNVDTFHREETKPAAITKMNVKLSGNNYVSPPTLKAYDEALNDNFKIKQTSVQIPVTEVKETATKQVFAVDQNEEDLMNKETLNLIKETLEHFKTQQTKSIEMFQNMISEQNKQSIELIQMLGKSFGNEDVANIPSSTNIKTPIKNGVSTPVSAPKPTNNGNGNGMSHQSGAVEKAKIVQTPEEVLDVPTPSKVESNQNTVLVTEILMKVVSEKTGYPAEMLELSMDMEADLGIDSIKRVEIFGAITEQHAELSNINPQELTELRTLGEIVSYISGKSVAPSTSAPQKAVPEQATAPAAIATPVVVETPKPVSNVTATANDSMVTEILMKVVSEKTGYPAEMLELSMDMEADLGIDSIKRVEIFGAITEQHAELSNINPQELTELRTLGEIVTYISGKSVVPSTTQSTPTPVAAAPVAKPVVETPKPAANGTAPAANDSIVTEILMKVVSEKTGYPAEMLELSMDMEADLGIDSIKRVEIFGAITEQHAELSNINPQELTELRTLGEIVTYISGKSVAPFTPQNTPAPVASAQVAQPVVETSKPAANGTAPAANDSMVTEILMKVVSEKTGYPAEMLELNMDMEADLGIDSIKRVEIFGAITEQHAELSDINPQELTELRTLGEIVNYISGKSKKKILA